MSARTLQGNDGTYTIEIWNLADGTAQRFALPAPDVFVDVSFTNDGLYFAALSAFGELASYRVSDGVIVAYLTPEGGMTTLTGGPLGGMVPAGDHSSSPPTGARTRWRGTRRRTR